MQLGDRYYDVMATAHEAVTGVCSDLHDQGIAKAIRPWFTMAYHVICASVPLFHFTIEQLRSRKDDPLSGPLIEFYNHKIDEEVGHDTMMLADVKKFGITAEVLRDEMPAAPVTAMVGSQYYLVAHYHPAVLIGYLGFLEGFAPSSEDIQQLAADSDVPEESWATMRLHAELDPHHKQEIQDFLNDLPVSPALGRAIIANGIRTGEYFCQALEGLLVEPGQN